MGEALCIDACKLRMSSFRYSKMFLDIPQVERMASGGHISLNTRIGVDLRQDKLIVIPKMVATLKLQGTENASEEDSHAGQVEIVAVAGYEIPEGSSLTKEEVDNIDPGQVEKFLHMLEPIMMMKLREMLSDAGARGVNIPPHVYVPNTAEFDQPDND